MSTTSTTLPTPTQPLEWSDCTIGHQSERTSSQRLYRLHVIGQLISGKSDKFYPDDYRDFDTVHDKIVTMFNESQFKIGSQSNYIRNLCSVLLNVFDTNDIVMTKYKNWLKELDTKRQQSITNVITDDEYTELIDLLLTQGEYCPNTTVKILAHLIVYAPSYCPVIPIDVVMDISIDTNNPHPHFYNLENDTLYISGAEPLVFDKEFSNVINATYPLNVSNARKWLISSCSSKNRYNQYVTTSSRASIGTSFARHFGVTYADTFKKINKYRQFVGTESTDPMTIAPTAPTTTAKPTAGTVVIKLKGLAPPNP